MRILLSAILATVLGALPLTLRAEAPLPRTLIAPSGLLPAGSAQRFQLLVLNPSAEAATLQAPATLECLLIEGTRQQPLRLEAVSPAPASLAAGAFVSLEYQAVLPEGFSGRVIVEERAGSSPLRAVLELGAPLTAASALAAQSSAAAHPASNAPAQSSPGPTTSFATKQPAASALERSFAGRLAAHDSIYFIAGTKPSVKFQFSFKYRALEFGGKETGKPRSLQFAYTQRSLWDITGASSPFYDTSYMPEVFYESLQPMPEKSDGPITWLGYQAGFRHESNGRDGSDSRSLNQLCVRGAASLGALDGWHLLVIPEFASYVGDRFDNPDIADYRGYGKLRLVAGRNRGPALMFTGIPGRGFHKGSVQLDFTLPLQTDTLSLRTYLLLQYFNGYGESLRSYRSHTESFRAGVSIVR